MLTVDLCFLRSAIRLHIGTFFPNIQGFTPDESHTVPIDHCLNGRLQTSFRVFGNDGFPSFLTRLRAFGNGAARYLIDLGFR